MDNERDEREETNYPDDGADFLCTPREPLVILNELLQLKRESIANKSLYRQLILIDEFLSAYPTSFVSFYHTHTTSRNKDITTTDPKTC